MDFDLRQWLLILGPLFIAGVLVHGYFRMRAGQNDIRMKLDKNFVSRPGDEVDDADDLNLLRAELPNGGARVIARPDLEEEVPVLMESVELPSISAVDEPVAVSPEQQSLDITTPKAPPAAATPEPEQAPSAIAEPAEESPAEQEQPKREPALKKQAPDAKEDAPPAVEKPEKFVVLNVLALDEPFQGQSLVELLVEAGLSHGEMDIFHRIDGAGEPLFSLANAVEPGTFDMNAIGHFTTPGVTMFMRVHELEKPLEVLDEMLGVADRIAQELAGEVRDETRSVMTPQTVEHCRQSIREFQFKHSA